MTQEHGTSGEDHRYTAREVLACPEDSPLRRNPEVCA